MSLLSGLSPRVRGNRAGLGSYPAANRSIPACAGEPMSHRSGVATVPVYPRVCGGTTHVALGVAAAEGLSPRVRGNQTAPAGIRSASRSIPACAGEPSPGATGGCRRGVYPRVCGGTPSVHVPVVEKSGLSPRVRGNPALLPRRLDLDRSIPACAGEPTPVPSITPKRRVYPRVCGGTFSKVIVIVGSSGLSPRVRGNP